MQKLLGCNMSYYSSINLICKVKPILNTIRCYCLMWWCRQRQSKTNSRIFLYTVSNYIIMKYLDVKVDDKPYKCKSRWKSNWRIKAGGGVTFTLTPPPSASTTWYLYITTTDTIYSSPSNISNSLLFLYQPSFHFQINYSLINKI